jgi:hypothetical protein
MAGLQLVYVRYFGARWGFTGHLLQGRFKSPCIEADRYLLNCGRHIERNPVAAGLVAAPWDWPWSSCRAYACGAADPLLAPNPWYEQFAPDPSRRRELWRAFLLGTTPGTRRWGGTTVSWATGRSGCGSTGAKHGRSRAAPGAPASWAPPRRQTRRSLAELPGADLDANRYALLHSENCPHPLRPQLRQGALPAADAAEVA